MTLIYELKVYFWKMYPLLGQRFRKLSMTERRCYQNIHCAAEIMKTIILLYSRSTANELVCLRSSAYRSIGLNEDYGGENMLQLFMFVYPTVVGSVARHSAGQLRILELHKVGLLHQYSVV